MNRACFLGVSLLLLACGGSLTPEQREKARKAIEEGKIKRITPVELTEAALKKGKEIIETIGHKDPFFNNVSLMDSVARNNEVVIYILTPDTKGISKEEISIAEAYQSQGDVAGVGDNVQKLSGDTLLYTMPVGNERPDGSRPFSHAIALKMAVKTVVNSIKD
jgi:hypothetical protein